MVVPHDQKMPTRSSSPAPLSEMRPTSRPPGGVLKIVSTSPFFVPKQSTHPVSSPITSFCAARFLPIGSRRIDLRQVALTWRRSWRDRESSIAPPTSAKSEVPPLTMVHLAAAIFEIV